MPRIALAAVAALLVAGAPAGAIAPPVDCGTMTLKGKRHQVKADQISCRTARRHVKAFVTRGRRPSGYRCQTYAPRKDRVRLSCADGRKTFLAIRR